LQAPSHDSLPKISMRKGDLGRLLNPRWRLWAFMVPLHILAFFLFYIYTIRVIEREVIATAYDTTREQLQHEAAELATVALAVQDGVTRVHIFQELISASNRFGYQLLLSGGKILSPDPPPAPIEAREINNFLASGEMEKTWLSESTPGEGTTFFVVLPAQSDNQPETREV